MLVPVRANQSAGCDSRMGDEPRSPLPGASGLGAGQFDTDGRGLRGLRIEVSPDGELTAGRGVQGGVDAVGGLIGHDLPAARKQLHLHIIKRHARGLQDLNRQAPSAPWELRMAEGHVNRIKMRRRQMFDRADRQLLLKRALLACQPVTRPGR